MNYSGKTFHFMEILFQYVAFHFYFLSNIVFLFILN